ncbi:Lysophospholipase, alpha-beta hydrolase superfamily [Oceanospirillum multiglobuliferum]|uniref:Serine aminopeptidase S33 domain-containing protein n=1 Tax=Oceanospirillum multiglobuliferum TaxID=64969 RepID=A0A1T4S1B4_9GAMM|nr:alpha/beta hydrolase [Oceanospirillum multiglobuliferum]OPX54537.1 hypothetical protein BTE48_13690 [Oceanospirillum multiglobuliferum]SKA21611.1 Lysophospholipase, alpha-beta hydrolase superfamily [Oceanospirillum multiglobuliferum]
MLVDPFLSAALRQQLLNHQGLSKQLLQKQHSYLNFYGLSRLLALADYELSCLRSGQYEVVYQYWRPKQDFLKGSFYLCHGYYDHVGLYGHLMSTLLEAGYAVIAFDLPGHGLSSGARASIISFDDYTQALWQVVQQTEAKVPKPLHLIGQSTGGAVVIDWWLRSGFAEQVPIACSVLLAPLVKPLHWQRALLSYHLLSPFLTRLKRKFSCNSHNENFLQFLPSDPLQARYLMVNWVNALKLWIPEIEQADPISTPVLILQGEGDHTVDWRYNTALLKEKFPDATVEFFPEARHHLVNESVMIRTQWQRKLQLFLQRFAEST